MNRFELGQLIEKIFNADGQPWSELKTISKAPVWAIQRADCDSFSYLSKHVPGHFTPHDIIGDNINEWTIFSIAFPRKEDIILENSKLDDLPAKSWFSSKIIMRRDMPLFMRELHSLLNNRGIITDSIEEIRKRNAVPKDNIHFWSERHVGYACGLGSFGLNGALISKAGVAVRLANLFIKAEFDEYDKIDESPFAACLYKQNGTCGVCIKRCPNAAITEHGHNSQLCRDQGYTKNTIRVKEEYGLDMAGCGLCLCKVPCSQKRPS